MFTLKHCFFVSFLLWSVQNRSIFSTNLTRSLLLLLCSLTSASSRFTEWRSSSSAHCSPQRRRWGPGRGPGPQHRWRPAPHCPGHPTAARSPWSEAHPKTVCGTVMGRWSPTPTFTCSEWLCCSGHGGYNDDLEMWWYVVTHPNLHVQWVAVLFWSWWW